MPLLKKSPTEGVSKVRFRRTLFLMAYRLKSGMSLLKKLMA